MKTKNQVSNKVIDLLSKYDYNNLNFEMVSYNFDSNKGSQDYALVIVNTGSKTTKIPSLKFMDLFSKALSVPLVVNGLYGDNIRLNKFSNIQNVIVDPDIFNNIKHTMFIDYDLKTNQSQLVVNDDALNICAYIYQLGIESRHKNNKSGEIAYLANLINNLDDIDKQDLLSQINK